ncbi:hypothetical protein GR160_00580 [Flavobacterium sp. Sd200]|uniref:hypothetical protein n=1 Tax=Flavobacterium sp. Sd200 TaxID=2692211 RepID=UPI00136C4279|nr:hypothetical protein [Flavobacterium sp. Sd200]MXN89709.1 hypothetical protein [Flavobacterium sp. Sd200]
MSFNQKELEKLLEESCKQLHKDFYKKFNKDIYLSAGGSKLEAFITDLQKEFETTASSFIANHKLEKDTEAKKRVFAITKFYAKKCVEDFSKI